MRSITFTKQQARQLVQNLESNGKGFNIGQLRKLNSLIDKISEHYTDFEDEIDRISRVHASPDLVEERNMLLGQLANTDGQDPIVCELEDADYDLLKDQWGGLQFLANKMARNISLGIDDAIKDATSPDPQPKKTKEKVS